MYSAGRWPKLCQSDNHLSVQHRDSSYSYISHGGPVVFHNRVLPGVNQVEVTVFYFLFLIFFGGCWEGGRGLGRGMEKS